MFWRPYQWKFKITFKRQCPSILFSSLYCLNKVHRVHVNIIITFDSGAIIFHPACVCVRVCLSVKTSHYHFENSQILAQDKLLASRVMRSCSLSFVYAVHEMTHRNAIDTQFLPINTFDTMSGGKFGCHGTGDAFYLHCLDVGRTTKGKHWLLFFTFFLDNSQLIPGIMVGSLHSQGRCMGSVLWIFERILVVIYFHLNRFIYATQLYCFAIYVANFLSKKCEYVFIFHIVICLA